MPALSQIPRQIDPGLNPGGSGANRQAKMLDSGFGLAAPRKQIAELFLGAGQVGLELDRRLQLGALAGRIPGSMQRDGQLELVVGVVRLPIRRLAIMRDGLRDLARRQFGVALGGVGARLGFGLLGLLELLILLHLRQRAIVLSQAAQRLGQLEVRLRLRGSQGNGLF